MLKKKNPNFVSKYFCWERVQASIVAFQVVQKGQKRRSICDQEWRTCRSLLPFQLSSLKIAVWFLRTRFFLHDLVSNSGSMSNLMDPACTSTNENHRIFTRVRCGMWRGADLKILVRTIFFDESVQNYGTSSHSMKSACTNTQEFWLCKKLREPATTILASCRIWWTLHAQALTRAIASLHVCIWHNWTPLVCIWSSQQGRETGQRVFTQV